MFAYCQGNPVNFQDTAGTRMVHADPYRGGPLPDSDHTSKKPDRNVLDFVLNDDEQKVLDAKHFAMYKGVPVVKLPNSRDAFSCGIIFIGNDVHSTATVNHEYGHYVHLMLIGVDNYVCRVALPSVIGYACNVPYNVYYSQPWEYIAEVLGGVHRNNYNYLEYSNISGALYMLFTLIP